MKERDYINATNRVKISAALFILRDVLPTYLPTDLSDGFSQVKRKLSSIEEYLFSIIEIEEQK